SPRINPVTFMLNILLKLFSITKEKRPLLRECNKERLITVPVIIQSSRFAGWSTLPGVAGCCEVMEPVLSFTLDNIYSVHLIFPYYCKIVKYDPLLHESDTTYLAVHSAG